MYRGTYAKIFFGGSESTLWPLYLHGTSAPRRDFDIILLAILPCTYCTGCLSPISKFVPLQIFPYMKWRDLEIFNFRFSRFSTQVPVRDIYTIIVGGLYPTQLTGSPNPIPKKFFFESVEKNNVPRPKFSKSKKLIFSMTSHDPILKPISLYSVKIT